MIGKLFLLALVGLGVGLAVPKTRAQLLTPVLERFYVEITPRRLEQIAGQLEMQRRRGERLPEQRNLSFWIERMTSIPPLDPWGNAYYIFAQREGFLLGSMGRDGVRGTEDDMTVTRGTPPRRR